MQVMRGIFVLAARILILSMAGAAVAQTAPPPPAKSPPQGHAVAKIREEAAALQEFVASPLARSFLEAVRLLPEVPPREVFIDRANRRYLSPSEAQALPEAERAKLDSRPLDESFYYNTKYGSPLAYSRALDLLATVEHPRAIKDLAEKKILDFGYGNIGQLRLMAAQLADVVGVDVDTILPSYYGQFDRFFTEAVPMPQLLEIDTIPHPGTIRLVHGRWPADAEAVTKVGGGYDLFISKNTLKRGYVHPEREADPRLLVNLGVSDEQYLAKLHEILNPGGWVMVYNLCPAPAPADKPYIPWADGRCPFSEEAIRAAGFEVLVYDRDDTEAARWMAHLLGWDAGEGGMNLKDDLFVWYTLLHKPVAGAGPAATPK
ncbi:MAG: hypothetical protein IT436_02980 [Phycisphaerales bacterium]|nr:hypothetical protein [Phycisphaerales bacterium]